MVSRQLFWGRVSCQEHTPLCPLRPLMKVWIPGSFYPKHWESLGLFSSPVMWSLEAGRKVVSPAGFHFSPECWNFPGHQTSLFSFNTWPHSEREVIPILSCISLLLSLHSLSGLGRNIILTTMPAGTKLIAGNKPVSFLTAQQLQQLQQQGQATQVRSKVNYWPYQAFLLLVCLLWIV